MKFQRTNSSGCWCLPCPDSDHALLIVEDFSTRPKYVELVICGECWMIPHEAAEGTSGEFLWYVLRQGCGGNQVKKKWGRTESSISLRVSLVQYAVLHLSTMFPLKHELWNEPHMS